MARALGRGGGTLLEKGFLLPSPKPLPFSQDFFMRRQVPALSGTKAEPSPQKPSSAQRPPADTAECASHRRAWDEQVEALLELPNAIARERCDNPFPHIFPGAQFVRISGSGVLEHLEGEWISGRDRYRLFAVRGEYSPLPPRHLSGFTRFIRTRSGGYWVRVTERGART